MNKIELIKKYGAEAILKTIVAGAKTSILESDSKRVKLDPKGAGEVKLFILRTDGLADYKRARNAGATAGYTEFAAGESVGSGYKVGDVGGFWETFKLQFDRGVQFRIDSVDDEEVDGLVMASVTTEFSKNKVIPEIDAVRFSRIAQYTNVTLGNRIEATIAANTILSVMNSALEYQGETEVDSENQAWFVRPAVMGFIRNTTELRRQLTQDEYKSATTGVTFKIQRYEGRPIIEVPSSRFYTDIVVDADNGFRPSSTSKAINFLLVDIPSVIPVVKVDKFRVFSPDQVQDFDGYKINVRIYHDLFVPTEYQAANYAHVSEINATTLTNKLHVALVEGSVQTAYKINASVTRPAGLYGELYVKTTAFTLGGNVTGATKVEKGVDILSAVAKSYFALAKDGKVIAVTAELDLPRKA